MKRLYLIRHAKSDWDHPGLSDEERPLSRRGSADAPFMAQWLAAHHHAPDVILTSPAVRARQTAVCFAEAFHIPEEQIRIEKNIYDASAQSLLCTIAASPDPYSTLLLVGHNYGLTDFVRYLAGGRADEMGTCTIAGFSLAIDSWRELTADAAHLDFQVRPKELRTP